MNTAERIEDIRIEQAAWCEGWRKSPLWLRLIGGPRQFYADRERSYRMRWGELSLRPCSIAIAVGGYETAHLHIALGVGQVFIRLPFLDKAICTGPNSIEQPRFGIEAHPTDLRLNWGRRCWFLHMPWESRYLFNQYLDDQGEWRPRLHHLEGEGAEAPHWSIELPYYYMLDDGEVQHVTATVTRTRSWKVWRWWGESTHPAAILNGARIRRAPLSDFLRATQKRFGHPLEYINIRFSEEVGARRGSWKGGAIGCSYEMKPGETPAHTLRRMQGERRFR